MRKIFTLFVLLLCLKNTKAQYVTIPDPYFVNWMIANIPSAIVNNQLDTNSLAVKTRTIINVSIVGISDLTGIEYFHSLKALHCSYNSITSLPVLPSTLLTLDCDNNHLTNLPFLPISLQTLNCGGNQLSTLPTLPNTLQTLNCGGNQLSTLPTLPNTLQTLNCGGNQLSTLPILPTSLQFLTCSWNYLTTLPPLPNTLQNIDCWHNSITTLPSLPNSLQILQCNTNSLTSLPTLPNSLTELWCSNNQITNVSFLPNSLTYFDCYSNNLSSLPNIPTSLSELWCGYNQLTSLPSIPNSIVEIYVEHNQLTSLPILPNSLSYLQCNNNQLTSLPILPNTLRDLYCQNNNIHCFNLFNEWTILGHHVYIDISNNPFSCLPNYISSMPPSLLSFPLCAPGNINGCGSANGLTGNILKDNNNDCIINTGDINLENIPVRLYNSSNNLLAQTYSNSNGGYSFFAQPTNTYNVIIDTLNIPLTATCNYPGIDSLVTVGISNSNIDFILNCKPILDIGIQSIIENGIIFPGQAHSLTVNAGDMSQWYNLNCASGTSATISLSVNGPVVYIGPALGALTPSVTGNIFSYNIADLGTINNATDLQLLFQTNTTAQSGDSVCIYATITPTNGDNNPGNNTFTYCYNVVNSYDPNIKEVYPVDVQPGFHDWLTYSIHFQNTGNAPAFNIRLADTLDNMLDLESFQVINYSHYNNTSVNGNVLNLHFPNIMLPDSTSNPSGSIGYIQYRIKPKATWAAPYKIKNTAYIYFDYNSPIVTNSTYNSILVPTGLNNASNTLATLYPNPTNGTFTVELNTKEKQSLQVFDISGQMVLSQTIENGKTSIDANYLAAGVYNICIKGSSIINKKLVVVK